MVSTVGLLHEFLGIEFQCKRRKNPLPPQKKGIKSPVENDSLRLVNAFTVSNERWVGMVCYNKNNNKVTII